MRELALNILDITENSVKAKATLIEITVKEEGNLMTVIIKDNGCGMSESFAQKVLDPFTTTRTTRKVGLGLPLLKMAADSTGGSLEIKSIHREDDPLNCGTAVKALFFTDHIDCPPLGDIVSTVVLLIQNAPFAPRYVYRHTKDGKESFLDTEFLDKFLSYKETKYPFIKIKDYIIDCGLHIDRTALIFATVLFLVSFCVQLFSIPYMEKEKRNYRFYALMNLFNFSALDSVVVIAVTS